jgi:GTP-binding protein
MKITSAEFVKSAFERAHWPVDSRPEIAFLGRSNVGKSSLLNSLLQRKGLARTSNTPGRTQSINYFLINSKSPASPPSGSDATGFYFVDLPGYGFAKVSKSMRADWGKMAQEYLSDREELALCIQLVDSRHKPSPLDLQLHEWLVFNEKEHVVVATKSDKLSANELAKQIRLIEAEMPGSRVIPYSSQTGKGRDAVWSAIATAIR